MQPLLLEMRGIDKSFPGVRALAGVDFDLRPGEVHVLLGENGAGKSTLVKILSGAYRPDAGTMLIGGKPAEFRHPHDARRSGIGTIYQELSLVPHLSVSANIFLGREHCHALGILNRRTATRAAGEVLQRLGIDLDPHASVGRLSVAQQQLVEIARALAFDSRILIMDEPTSALTVAEIQRLFELVRKLRADGKGIIYISHRMEEIRQIGDRVTVLRDGKKIATRSVLQVPVEELIRLMADRELGEHFPRRRVPAGERLLEVRDLCTRGKLQDVSFDLHAGEIVGVAGLMGSGRSTLARALFGAEPILSGHIRIRQQRSIPRSPRYAIRSGLGFLPENRQRSGLVLNLSVKRNITLANTESVFVRGVLRNSREQALAHKQVQRLRIKTPSLDQTVDCLSGGNQQKVVLGKWLARGAGILVFDEPTRGIDVAAKVDLYELMNELTAQGAGILMISSDLPEVLGMGDRILVLHQGRVSGSFDRRDTDQRSVLRAALGEVP